MNGRSTHPDDDPEGLPRIAGTAAIFEEPPDFWNYPLTGHVADMAQPTRMTPQRTSDIRSHSSG
jgi:hypothetical protein